MICSAKNSHPSPFTFNSALLATTTNQTMASEKYAEAYAAFRIARNAATFNLFAKPEEQTQKDYALYHLKKAEPHRRVLNDTVDEKLEALRAAGRKVFDFYHRGELSYTYLMERGYCELSNVYQFTATLDALNWKVMYAPKYKTVHFDNWLEVAAMNEESREPIYKKFIWDIARITKLQLPKELYPLPELFVPSIVSDILDPTLVPECIFESAGLVRAMFQTKTD